MLNLKLYISAALCLFALGCGTTIFDAKEDNLARPLGLSITQEDDLEFTIRFFVSNEEEIFLGYNLYVGRASIADADFLDLENNRLVNLILPAGEEPSYTYSNSDADAASSVSKTVRFYDGTRERFECGQRYYFRIRAVGQGKIYSPPSNEVNAIAKEDVGQDC